MPIPHTDISCPEKGAKIETEIFCWWPGSPRLEKGWDILKLITQDAVKGGEKVCLIATENAALIPHPEGIQIKSTKNNLTRE